jgi:hypothetical protein
VIVEDSVPALPSWLTEPLWDQFAVLLPTTASSASSGTTRELLAQRGLHGQISHQGDTAPIHVSQRWQVQRTNSWHNAINRLQRCSERREIVINAYFDLADAIITTRSLIRTAWTTHRWDTRPHRR